jgi:CheY-like chemotaxis protein
MTQRPKVLMIDDNKEICRLMKEYLEKSGRYEVTVFTEAGMGVRYAQIEKPDVILLDLMMPDMDGTEAAEYLLDDEATRNIPIIFITAAIKKAEVEQLAAAGKPWVAHAVSWYQTHDPSLVYADRHALLVPIALAGDAPKSA